MPYFRWLAFLLLKECCHCMYIEEIYLKNIQIAIDVPF